MIYLEKIYHSKINMDFLEIIKTKLGITVSIILVTITLVIIYGFISNTKSEGGNKSEYSNEIVQANGDFVATTVNEINSENLTREEAADEIIRVNITSDMSFFEKAKKCMIIL